MAGVAGHSVRADHILGRAGPPRGHAQRIARRRACQRVEPDRHRGSVPPRDRQQRQAHRLWRRTRQQADSARAGTAARRRAGHTILASAFDIRSIYRALNSILNNITRRFRSRRMAKLERLLGITASTRILDVGGTPANWTLLGVRPQVIMLNLPRAMESGDDGLEWVFADGLELPFRDKSFDVVFSNSVIEHVGDPPNQEQFAREIARVGVRYFVQTPNSWFPVGHHLLTRLIHFLPLGRQRRRVA